MADPFTLAINIILASYAFVATVLFWFSWRKRSDLVYWFIALIIYTSGHTLLIFKQSENGLLFAYLGNAALVLSLLIVMTSTFFAYIQLFFKRQKDKLQLREERIILAITLACSIIIGILIGLFLYFFAIFDLFAIIIVTMIVLLFALSVFVLRIYLEQKTITRLIMFIVFLVGLITAVSTILAVNFPTWGDALNYACNFIFMSFIVIGGLAAPIEQRITDSEEKYRNLSENLEVIVDERTQQLEKVNKELEAFSYSVSHDLKAPLRSISGFSKAIKEDFAEELSEQAVDYLERILANSEKMNELINDLLDLSKITREEMQMESVNLSEIAQDVLDELLELHQGKNITYDIEQEIYVVCDRKFLRIVISNLLGNAIKFSFAKPEIKIKFGMKEENNQKIFFVQDNGAGFDMKYYDKLFGLFQRLHSSNEFQGTGVGLITVKRIIERHNGRIWAEGEVNKGATFYFTLN